MSFDDVRVAALRKSASDFATAQGNGPDATVDTAKGHQRRGRAIMVHSARPQPQAKEKGNPECIRKRIMHTSGVRCLAEEPQGLNF